MVVRREVVPGPSRATLRPSDSVIVGVAAA